MAGIMSVLGVMDASALGHCQMHEHIFVRATPASERAPALRIDDEARSLRELARYREAGGAALVDCQPVGAGRDAAALSRLSRESGVGIVAVTGYHLPDFYPAGHWIREEGCDAMRARFLAELQAGCEEAPSVRAGAVKAAISAQGPCGRFALCLRAAAGAAAIAGVPLILHTERGAGAVEAVRIAEREGLDPARIAVCHVDRQAEDFAPHEAVAATGAYLEYDTIARYKYHDDAAERRLIAHMLERGYLRRLLLSLDTTAARLRSYGGAPGLDFLLRDFLPGLREMGLSDAELDVIARENPRRVFE